MDILEHLRTAAEWKKQLHYKLASSPDALVRHQISKAINGITHLQHLCFSVQALLTTKDILHNGASFHPIPRWLQATPSVITQLCQQLDHQDIPISSNYFHVLSSEDDCVEIPQAPRNVNKTMAQVPTTFHKDALDALIKEFTEKDLPAEQTRSPSPEVVKSFRIRLSIRMGQFMIHCCRTRLKFALTYREKTLRCYWGINSTLRVNRENYKVKISTRCNHNSHRISQKLSEEQRGI